MACALPFGAIAYLQVRVIHNESTIHKEAYNKKSSQFASEISASFVKIGKSDSPLRIANAFEKKRWEDLKNLGVKSITINL
jgi:hypothetical protein